jgi:hypothetical protein
MLRTFGFPNLIEMFPDGPEKEAYLYSSCKILYVELNLSFEGKPKKKFLVLIDAQEPPLFFLINSQKRGMFNQHDIPLYKADYPGVFTHEVSYLHYLSVANNFDFADSVLPTKEELLSELRQNTSCVKGLLRVEDAKAVLEGIDEHRLELDLNVEQEERIVQALGEYIKTKK